MSRWSVYKAYFLQLNPVLQEMTRNGVSLDMEAVNTALVDLKAELSLEPCPLVPEAVLEHRRFSRDRPGPDGRSLRLEMIPGKVKVCSHCGAEVTSKTEHLKGGKKKNPCAAAKATLQVIDGMVPSFLETLPFNPMSAQALARYAEHMGHKARLHHKTKVATYDDTTLEMFIRKYGAAHPLYAWVLHQRKHLKALTNFFLPLQGRAWTTGTFTHNPESGRLSMQNVNFQQWSKSGDVAFAKELRNCVVARPGHTFVGADSSSIEAVMVGWLADDPEYLAIALRGIHAFLACKELGLAFTPTNIDFVKSANKALYNRKKRTVHGSAYCMTPPMLAQNYPAAFPSVADAKREQDAYFALCPAVPAWWDRTRDLAARQGYLENPWGFRNYFWKVFQKDHTGQVTLGPDGKSVVSFLPQSSAAFWMRRCLIEIDRRRHRTWRMPAIGAIHDGYILETPTRDAEDAEALLIDVLTAPIPQMGGLRIGAEADRGDRWGDMHTTIAVQGAAPL